MIWTIYTQVWTTLKAKFCLENDYLPEKLTETFRIFQKMTDISGTQPMNFHTGMKFTFVFYLVVAAAAAAADDDVEADYVDDSMSFAIHFDFNAYTCDIQLYRIIKKNFFLQSIHRIFCFAMQIDCPIRIIVSGWFSIHRLRFARNRRIPTKLGARSDEQTNGICDAVIKITKM